MIKNHLNKIIIYCISLFPLIDLITAIMTYKGISLSIGMFVKVIVLAIMYVLLLTKYKKNRFTFICTIILTITLALNMTSNYTQILGKFNLEYIKLIIKYSFLIINILFFNNFIKENDFDLSILKPPIKLILLSMLIALITNSGIPSYSLLNKIGTCGWFYSANELGVLLTLFYPITIYLFLNYNESKKYEKLYVILNGLFLIMLGTKTGLFAFFIITILYVLYRIIFIKKYSYKNGFILTIIILLISMALFNHLPGVLNIKNKYNSISDSYETKEELRDEMIYSGRTTIKANMNKKSTNKKLPLVTVYNRALNGYISFANFQLLEMDFHDIYNFFGVIGLSFTILLIIYSIVFTPIKMLKKLTLINQMNLYVSIILSLLIAYIAGHTLLSPMVSFYLSIIMAFIYKNYRDSDQISNKKQILFSTVHTEYGGIEKSLVNLLKNINYDKYDVDLLVLLDNGPLKGEIPSQVRILTPYNRRLAKIFCSNRIFSKVIKHAFFNKLTSCFYTLNKKYDVAIDYCGYYGFITQYVKCTLAKRKYIWFHSDPNILNKVNSKSRYEKFDKIILVSNDSKKRMLKIWPEYRKKLTVIRNVVVSPKITNKKIKWENNSVKILCIGRITKVKRYDKLIDVANKLSQDHFKFEIIVLGDGELMNETKNRIKKLNLDKKIRMLGNKNNVGDYMKSADFLLLVSDYEGLPTVLIEALSCNLPYIATDVCGSHEVSLKIAPKNSFLLTNNDVNSIYQSIKKFDYKTNFSFDINSYNETNIKDFEKLIGE